MRAWNYQGKLDSITGNVMTAVGVSAGWPTRASRWRIGWLCSGYPLAQMFGWVIFACMLVWIACLALPGGSAWAADEDQNLVDPTQRADNSFIYDTTIESLFDQSSLYNDRTVQVEGEVIGDRINVETPGYCWITLTVTDSEDKSSISVFMSDEQASQIDRYGKYGVTGTILQVRGIYHQSCSEHEGLPDIHATNSSVISKGIEQPDAFNGDDFVPGLVACIIGALMLGAFYFARERTR